MGKFYNIRQASDMLGIKVRTAREWIKTGKLKAKKYECSNRWFIAEDEIRRLINNGNENREYTG